MNLTIPGVHIRPGATVTEPVDDIAPDGRGVIRHGQGEILVRGAWPGDVVEARVYKRRRTRFEAYALAVLEEGTPRRVPPCIHVHECGGCRWQHWTIEDQRAMKRHIVARSLAAVLDEAAPVVLPVREVGPEFGYRNKMEFAFSSDEDGAVTLGLHRPGSYLVTFDLERCWLAPPEASEVVAWVRDWAKRNRLPAYDKRAHDGLLRHLVIRVATATGEIMANVVAAHDGFDGIEELATGLAEAIPQVKSILLSANAGEGDTTISATTRLLAGKETITERIGPFEVELSSRSFLQTNTRGAEVLYEIVRERAALTGSERVLDLYCGIGLIGLWLADGAREVIGVEQVPEAVADAERLRGQTAFDHVRFLEGDAEALLPDWVRNGTSFDVAVVDPPRVGLHPKALAALVKLAPPRIVYVSCNPQSLARDMKRLLEAGYVPGAVEPLDMFPQTAHVESVVRLDRRS